MPAFLREATTDSTFEVADFAIIGRSEGATIRIDDSGISRQHATIRREGEHYWLVDLGSANGSYVNEVALTQARALAHGDRIRLAGLTLIFSLDAANTGVALNDRTMIAQSAYSPFASEDLTLFVADLKGFSQLSTRLTAEQVADLLREWYADCRSILQGAGATIDKFIGDCVFAYWHGTGTGVRSRALDAAQALRSVEFTSQSPTRRLMRETHGIALDCGIGLHVGRVVVGSMGRGINTALGDAVNVVFSIESLTRSVGRPILSSAAFLDGWEQGREMFDPCGAHPIKGHIEALDVFAVRNLAM